MLHVENTELFGKPVTEQSFEILFWEVEYILGAVDQYHWSGVRTGREVPAE